MNIGSALPLLLMGKQIGAMPGPMQQTPPTGTGVSNILSELGGQFGGMGGQFGGLGAQFGGLGAQFGGLGGQFGGMGGGMPPETSNLIGAGSNLYNLTGNAGNGAEQALDSGLQQAGGDTTGSLWGNVGANASKLDPTNTGELGKIASDIATQSGGSAPSTTNGQPPTMDQILQSLQSSLGAAQQSGNTTLADNIGQMIGNMSQGQQTQQTGGSTGGLGGLGSMLENPIGAITGGLGKAASGLGSALKGLEHLMPPML